MTREPHLAGPAVRLAVLNATLQRMRGPCSVCQRPRSLSIATAMAERARWIIGHSVNEIAKRLDQRPESIRLIVWGNAFTSPARGEEETFCGLVAALQAAVDATSAPWNDEDGAWADGLRDFALTAHEISTG